MSEHDTATGMLIAGATSHRGASETAAEGGCTGNVTSKPQKQRALHGCGRCGKRCNGRLKERFA